MLSEEHRRQLWGVPPPGPWAKSAACRGMSPTVFVATEDPLVAEAKDVCAGCLVVAHCRSYGLRWRPMGVWGGWDDRDRAHFDRMSTKQKRRSRLTGRVVAAEPFDRLLDAADDAADSSGGALDGDVDRLGGLRNGRLNRVGGVVEDLGGEGGGRALVADPGGQDALDEGGDAGGDPDAPVAGAEHPAGENHDRAEEGLDERPADPFADVEDETSRHGEALLLWLPTEGVDRWGTVTERTG